MPPKKKQNTGEASEASGSHQNDVDQEHEHDLHHKEAGHSKSTERDMSKVPEHEYVCVPRPLYDFEAENNAREGESRLELEDVYDEYAKAVDAGSVNGFPAAKDRPDWKWVMMWGTCQNWLDYRRRTQYCLPDNFNMYIYNDFHPYGQIELIQNMLLDFDAALKKKSDDALKSTWEKMATLANWLSSEDDSFTRADDGEGVLRLCTLIGNALLRALAAIDHAGELKADSSFLDIPIVISSMLEWSFSLDDYGLDENQEWRNSAITYFRKGGFDPRKGMFGTEQLLQKAEATDAKKLPPPSDKDPWKWDMNFTVYKRNQGKIGGRKYDITKMTRKERANHAFDNKDPLQHISEKDLKEDKLEFS